MVILRPTRKLHALLKPSGSPTAGSDTALGDWYGNRVVVDRQPLLLLVSSASLVSLIVPARDVRALPERLASLVAVRLRRLGLPPEIVDAEIRAMTAVSIGPTIDRSVLGIVVDFGKAIPFHLEPGRWSEDTLPMVEDRLAETPCYASRPSDRVVFPDKKGPELLMTKWLSEFKVEVQRILGRFESVHPTAHGWYRAAGWFDGSFLNLRSCREPTETERK